MYDGYWDALILDTPWQEQARQALRHLARKARAESGMAKRATSAANVVDSVSHTRGLTLRKLVSSASHVQPRAETMCRAEPQVRDVGGWH